jgi:ribose transport system substrate-binding protein
VKKILALVLVLAMVLSLAACGKTEEPAGPGGNGGNDDGNGEPKKEFKIGVVIPSGDHGFTGESVAHAKMEAEALMEKYDGLEISVRDGLEASDQITSIENLISGGDVDLIMLWPMEGEALRSAAQSILDAGIELVIYDRLIENFDGIVGEIMGDNYGIATLMGEYINDYFKDETEVQYLRFVGDSSTVTSQRSEGMDAVIDDKFEQVANTFVTNWSTETAQEQMENWLNARSVAEIEDLDLIVTHDDEVVDGVMNALEAYTGEADLNVKLITSVGGREDTLVKFETTKTDIKFTTFYFAPAFIREALRLSVAHLYDEPYDGAVLKDGQYLIPSFSISNAGNADHDFDSYRNSDIYEERYSIGNF